MSHSSSSPPTPSDTKKKRKRTDPTTDELEIDVSLPEPPSKKALRRAKKGKPATTGVADASSKDDASDLLDPPAPVSGLPTALAPGTVPAKRSEHAVWIGNLPFFCTPSLLRSFFYTAASLEPANITRVNLPSSTRPILPVQLITYRRAAGHYQAADAGSSVEHSKRDKGTGTDMDKEPKFQNKGFAYVDFDSAASVFQALQATETEFVGGGGRKVLVKDAKSFVGRPERTTAAAVADGGAAGRDAGLDGVQKPRSKRIFVGNLGFDVTREDIQGHFAQAGSVEDVFMASFEDTGKCKGYAWVRFSDEDEAERAVKGWVWKIEGRDDVEDEGESEGAVEEAKGEKSDGGDSDAGDAQTMPTPAAAKKSTEPGKKRKWWINKLYGRMLRCEYAEDASTRYKKRFRGVSERGTTAGPDAVRPRTSAGGDEGAVGREGGDEGAVATAAATVAAPATAIAGKPPRRPTEDQRRDVRRQKHRDARKVAPGQALANAPRASGAIVASKGTRVTFD